MYFYRMLTLIMSNFCKLITKKCVIIFSKLEAKIFWSGDGGVGFCQFLLYGWQKHPVSGKEKILCPGMLELSDVDIFIRRI